MTFFREKCDRTEKRGGLGGNISNWLNQVEVKIWPSGKGFCKSILTSVRKQVKLFLCYIGSVGFYRK